MSVENGHTDKPMKPSEGSQQSSFVETWRKVSFKQWKTTQVVASPLPIFLQKFLSISKDAEDTELSLRNGLTYMTELPQGDDMRVKCQNVIREFITAKLPAREETEELASISQSNPLLNDRHLYGRSCKEFAGDKNSLPSPDKVFESLLCIPDDLKTQEHPNQISSMVYAFAILISLCLERPDEDRSELNQTSPFLDLSPLYGFTREQTWTIRKGDGSGKLIPDRYCEDRTTFVPPATIVLLVLWNRNHNYIADQLLKISSDWNGIPSDNPDSRLKDQDEEIFELARKVNCNVFRNMVMEDFLKVLLGLPVIGSGFGDPEFFKTRNSKLKNYKSSIEFGLLHHCSVLASEADRKYLRQTACEGSTPNGVAEAINLFFACNYPGLCEEKRDYDNYDLLTILRDATDSVAAAPGACRIPQCLKSYQTKIMERARKWNVCSLNEFRKSLGLKPFANFEQWNSDPEVSKAAERLYGNIDNLELYPGLQAEKLNADSGFALGSTMTYGLLVDIIASLINDPSPVSLSKDGDIVLWIAQECGFQSDNGASGAMLPTLFLRHFPEAYSSPNIYALFPFSIPSSTRMTLQRSKAKMRASYNSDSFQLSNTQYSGSIEVMKESFSNPKVFTSPYAERLQLLTGGYGFLLGFDDPKLHDADLNLILLSLFPKKEYISHYCRFFRNAIEDQLGALVGEVDIMRVINTTCVQWVSKTMCSLPGKDDEATYKLLSAMHGFLFGTHKPENGWKAQEEALNASEKLSKHIGAQILASLPSKRGRLRQFLQSSAELVGRVAMELWGPRKVGQPSPIGFLSRMVELSEREGLEAIFGSWSAMQDRFSHVIQEEFPDLIGASFDQDSDQLARRIGKEAWDLKLTENAIKKRIRTGFKELVDKKHSLLSSLRGDLDELSEDDFNRLLNNEKVRRDNQTSWRLASCCAKRDLKKNSRRHLLTQRILFEHRIREKRLVANILGLCIMSVTLAQACSQSLMFHLLSDGKTEGLDKDAIKDIIRDSFKFRSPLSVYRIAQSDVELRREDGTLIQKIQKGDHLYADIREVGRPGGVGFHKCPVFGLNKNSFLDEVMPETLQTIFRLEKLGLGNADRLKKMHHTDSKQASILQSLVVTFKKFLPRVVWKKPPVSARLKTLRFRLNVFMFFAILCLIVFGVIHALLGKINLPSISLFPDRSPVNLNCTGRTEVFDPYHDVMIRRGPDGKPIPVEISYRSRKPYKVTVIDVDKRDLRLNLWVDSQNKGLTRDFVLNKSMDCGDNLAACLNMGYSAGVIVIPPGKHTVKLEWAGKEYIPGTQNMDWGGNYTRRFKLQREYCL